MSLTDGSLISRKVEKLTFQSHIFILSTVMNVNMKHLNYSVILKRIACTTKFLLCAHLHHYCDADFLTILKAKHRFTDLLGVVFVAGDRYHNF